MSNREERREDGQQRGIVRVESPWLTTDETVAYLGLPSRRALYQAVRRGQIPVRRLGERRMRFHREDLDKLFAAR